MTAGAQLLLIEMLRTRASRFPSLLATLTDPWQAEETSPQQARLCLAELDDLTTLDLDRAAYLVDTANDLSAVLRTAAETDQTIEWVR